VFTRAFSGIAVLLCVAVMAVGALAPQAKAADAHLVVRARGSTGDEIFEVRAGGQVVLTQSVTTSWKSYSTSVPLGTSLADVQVAFINDVYLPNYDRNLYVDYVEFGGERFESEAPSTLGTGTWQPNSRCVAAKLQSEALHCNGFFQYTKSRSVNVLSVRFLPDTDNDGVIDFDTTNYRGTVGELRSRIDRIEAGVARWTTEATRYRGEGEPSIVFAVTEEIESLGAVPIGLPFRSSFRPDYRSILNAANICEKVDSGAIKEVWMWTQHYGNIEPAESNLSSPTMGDISNSERTDDLPICANSYTVYNFNFTRGVAEALHNRGHQTEAFFRATDTTGIWRLFEDRCGNTHFPPNGIRDYDYRNPVAADSVCDGWLLGTDTVDSYTCSNHFQWTTGSSACTSDGGLAYYVWWFQRFPHGGSIDGIGMRNWWDYYADLDAVIESGTWLSR